jgi:hypothetical protein
VPYMLELDPDSTTYIAVGLVPQAPVGSEIPPRASESFADNGLNWPIPLCP